MTKYDIANEVITVYINPISEPTQEGPAWMEYTFDRPCKLHEMWVWNSNQSIESLPGFGFGAKDVTVEYSVDGESWTTLDDFEFAQAPGKAAYAHNINVNFGGVVAQHIRLTIHSNWGGRPPFGLGEVRFFFVPVRARAPQPADEARGVDLDVVLAWKAGREAEFHHVYLSTDMQAVADGNDPLTTVTDNRYVSDTLNLGQTYYWKINESNEAADPSLWEGDVWSFSTTRHRVLDDFEQYTNDAERLKRVLQTWIDGAGYSNPIEVPGNGTDALVGHDIWDPGSEYFEGDLVETDDVHSGGQAMPLYFDNSSAPYYSQADRTWTPPLDLTAHGATEFSVWFKGAPAAWKVADDSIILSASGWDIWDDYDEFRFVYKQLAGNGSIVARVESVEETDGWAKAGVMIRESLDPGGRHASVMVTPSNGVSFQRRLFIGGVSEATTQEDVEAPRWVRLTRTGNTLKAEHSADGLVWESVGDDADESSEQITLMGSVYIGLCLTSHNEDTVTVAEFSGVETSGATGVWQMEEVGTDHPANDQADFYVSLVDNRGQKAVVAYPDGANVSAWTSLTIPLSDLAQYIDPTQVTKVSVGVGNPDTPVMGGQGLVLVDDLRTSHIPATVVREIAFEGFDYEDGALDGLDGGTGFDGPWEDEDASHAVFDNRLLGTDSGSIFQDFPGGTFVDDGTTYWWSARVESDGASWAWIRPWGEASLTLYIEDETVGLCGGDTGDWDEGFFFPADRAVWVVVKLVTDPDNDDTVYMFLDPDPSSEPQDADAASSIVVGPIEDYTMVEIATEEGSTAGVALDELRWGTGFESVVGGQ